MTRRLIALAIQGPSNRAMLLVSAARYAARSGRKLVLCWHPDLYRYHDESGVWSECGWYPGPHSYEDFFDERVERISLEECRQLDWMPTDHPDAGNYDRNAIPFDDPRPDLVVSGWRMIHDEGEPNLEWIETATPDQRRVLDDVLRFVPIITPNRAIRSAASEIAWNAAIGSRTLGIQIRRQHDYTKDIPLENYRAAIKKEIGLGIWRNAFLCSDNLAVEAEFAEYCRGLGLPTFTRQRDGRGLWEKIAAGDGLLDLMLLSYCDSLIGSAGSSFSEQAWILAGARDGGVSYVRP